MNYTDNTLEEILQDIKNTLKIGDKVHKSTVIASILRITDEGISYSIGNNGSNKIISNQELLAAIKTLLTGDIVNRKWHEGNFPKENKSSPCNITTICGILLKYKLAIKTKDHPLTISLNQQNYNIHNGATNEN